MYKPYDGQLKSNARRLRKEMTREEHSLWYHLRRKQVLDIKFLRQKPVFGYILDFYAPTVKFAIEVDGSQHYEKKNNHHDCLRDINLNNHGITVARYSNWEINCELICVLEDIYNKLRLKI